jgi:hypothetical protein
MTNDDIKHTCTSDGRAQPFGRKAPRGECPRCDQLHDGAAPRSWAGTESARRNARYDRQEDDRRRANIAAGRCACGQPSNHGICTYGEW